MNTRMRIACRAFAVCLTIGQCLPTSAGTIPVPFQEDFVSGPANWYDSAGTSLLSWNAEGGPDGGSFVTTTFNFAQAGPTDTPPLFRAHDTFNSSNDAFVGDWLAAGVSEFHAWIRHDADTPITFFSRFAPAFGPGAVALSNTPVPLGVWTELIVPIGADSFIYEGPVSFDGLFHSIGNIQIGVIARPLAGMDQTITFGLDKVGIVPEPGSLTLLLVGAVVLRFGIHGKQGR